MNRALIVIAFSAGLLAGCVSHEGTYAPSCIAYAGSNITLTAGEFVWDKFTDEVIVNDDGEVVDQFPGYPLRGTYRINGQIVLMTSGDGEVLERMYLQRRDADSYLYTAEQFEHWKTTGEHAKCALVLEKSSNR